MRSASISLPLLTSTSLGDDTRSLLTALHQVERVARTMNSGVRVRGRVKKRSATTAKATRLGVEVGEVFDHLGVRVIVRDTRECYQLIDLLHGSFEHLPEHYDDYVAAPKANGYQALHSILVHPGAGAFEVQVRTRAMHRRARAGASSHAEYERDEHERSNTAAAIDRESWMAHEPSAGA